MVNYTDGRITYMTSPVLEVDGKTSLREGDSLKKVTAVFPKARIQMAEDGRNIAVLPGARTYIQFHEDRVVEFQINSRRFPSL